MCYERIEWFSPLPMAGRHLRLVQLVYNSWLRWILAVCELSEDDRGVYSCPNSRDWTGIVCSGGVGGRGDSHPISYISLPAITASIIIYRSTGNSTKCASGFPLGSISHETSPFKLSQVFNNTDKYMRKSVCVCVCVTSRFLDLSRVFTFQTLIQQ